VEGETDDPEIILLRNRQKRNFITTLLLSQGVPMLVAGDECGRTQKGNNNAYCQDNEISWFDWANADSTLFEFTKSLIRLRLNNPVFCRRHWFHGEKLFQKGTEDIAWFLPDGFEMNEEHWLQDFAKSLAVYLDGNWDVKNDEKNDSFYIAFNGHFEPVEFRFPERKYGAGWKKIIDTNDDFIHDYPENYRYGTTFLAPSRCILLYKKLPDEH
jgi:glycogen operon protein